MYLEVISPEAVLFSSNVDAITVPGTEGEFQLLNNHAPIVSSLKRGKIKIRVDSFQTLDLDLLHRQVAHTKKEDNKILSIPILSGIIEMKNNKAVILID